MCVIGFNGEAGDTRDNRGHRFDGLLPAVKFFGLLGGKCPMCNRRSTIISQGSNGHFGPLGGGRKQRRTNPGGKVAMILKAGDWRNGSYSPYH
jgi:hypothetical protein